MLRKYKKQFDILILILIIVSLNGCKKEEFSTLHKIELSNLDFKYKNEKNLNFDGNKIIEDIDEENKSKYDADKLIADLDGGVNLSIKIEEFNLEGRRYISYPQIYGFEDKEKENAINELIKNDILKIIDGEAGYTLKNKDFYFYQECEVKFFSEKYISIFYKGDYGISTTMRGYDPIALTTTIDIEKEKVLTLNEVIKDFDLLIKKLVNDEFEGITMWEGATGYKFNNVYGYLLNEYGIDKLKMELSKNKFDIEYNYVQWYFTENNFVFVMGNKYYNEFAIGIDDNRELYTEEFLFEYDKINNE